jgi:SpoVK/Ycf46/Vps4 family AAA+-type ATPase
VAPALDDVARAARARPQVKLEALAARREARARWEDLILPGGAMAQLRELADRVRHRDRVFEDWGFAARVGHRQTSVLALFTGPSGTGKTLAAEIVAARLGLDLYCIDLAQVVSKYIGETEKNLSRVFDAAEGAAAVLFFDEADGIFGKRTETRDAHDRYANLEVSYLLGRLETFTGLAIMASNLRQNIDAAFLRRMDFVVEFPMPDTAARTLLWERHLRCGAPIAEDVDVHEVADLFPVTGAHIRNAAVGAAFLAAGEDAPISRRHLFAAMHREYNKLGKAFPGLGRG